MGSENTALAFIRNLKIHGGFPRLCFLKVFHLEDNERLQHNVRDEYNVPLEKGTNGGLSCTRESGVPPGCGRHSQGYGGANKPRCRISRAQVSLLQCQQEVRPDAPPDVHSKQILGEGRHPDVQQEVKPDVHKKQIPGAR